MNEDKHTHNKDAKEGKGNAKSKNKQIMPHLKK